MKSKFKAILSRISYYPSHSTHHFYYCFFVFLFLICSSYLCLFIPSSSYFTWNNYNNKFAWAITNNIKNITHPDKKEIEYLKSFALETINNDRIKFGLKSVSLSNNTAAQIQADESLRTERISHWDTNGLKPYMLYSRYNGTGYVQQNIAQISYTYSNSSNLKSSEVCNNIVKPICTTINPQKAISTLENSMMYNDLICCNNGHKNNILNKFHTNVSIGIAFNKYYFVIVQNFENQYFDKNYKIEKSNDNIINFKAKILDPIKNNNDNSSKQNDINKSSDDGNFTINHIAFYLDDKPTKIQYEKNKNKSSYDFGDLKLMVSKPLTSDKKYIQQSKSYKIIEAKKWEIDKDNINLEIKIPSTIDKKDKLITMVVYAKDINNINNKNDKALISADTSNINELVPISAYTFFN